jgi:hypothetical protein
MDSNEMRDSSPIDRVRAAAKAAVEGELLAEIVDPYFGDESGHSKSGGPYHSKSGHNHSKQAYLSAPEVKAAAAEEHASFEQRLAALKARIS